MNGQLILYRGISEQEKDILAGIDIPILFSVIFLVGIGVVMVYSASSALALNKFGSDFFFLKKQIFFAITGFGLMLLASRFPVEKLPYLTYPLLFFTIALLVIVHVPGFGLTAGGATRWLKIGNFTFQPSELARLTLILYLAYSMSKKQDRLEDFSIGFLPHLLFFCLFGALILTQPDFGSVVILGAITWAMMFVAGIPLKHLIGSVFALIPVTFIFLVGEAYRLERVFSFFDPWAYPQKGGYQIIHSLMAFGSGGIWGKGLGQGYQKLFYLPEPHTDFIFSVVGEELGLLGVIIILFLYGLILYRGIRIAMEAKDAFSSLLAAGITIALGTQICINIGVTLALLPTKGLTLPFLSYGGTSLLLNLISMGILMSISASQKKADG